MRKHKGNRRTDRIELHATDLYNTCLRQFLLAYKNGINIHSFEQCYPDKTYLTFKLGDKIEEIVREMVGGYKPNPMALKVKDIIVIGSPDIVVEISGKKVILECKSIKKENYERLTEPLPQHEEQLQTYLWLATKFPNLNYAKVGAVVYVPKQETTPLIKIFTVKYDKVRADKFERMLKKIKDFVSSGKLPMRICVNERAGEKQGCKFVNECFKEEL